MAASSAEPQNQPLIEEAGTYRAPPSDDVKVRIMHCGIGHVFGCLPFDIGLLPCVKRRVVVGQSRRPRETTFARICQACLLMGTVLALLSCLLFHLARNEGNGTTVGINKTDGYAPLGVQALLITWLVVCNVLLHNLEDEAQHVAVTVAEGASHARFSVSSRGTASHELLTIPDQSTLMVNLREVKFNPALVSPDTSELVRSAVDVITRIAYRGIQASQYGPTFYGAPDLPESGSYYKSLLLGFFMAGAQVVIIRLLYDSGARYDRNSALATSVYWVSTIQFFLALFLFYSLLNIILSSYRQQHLLISRFNNMLVPHRAQRAKLPYLLMNSQENVQAFHVIRKFLIDHITQPNALSTVIDPTFAMLVLGVLAASTVLVIRLLFKHEPFDLFSGGCFNLLGASIIYISGFSSFGLLINNRIKEHVQILAHIQWEITSQWNRVLERIEKSDQRRQDYEATARRLWALKGSVQCELEVCVRDPKLPRLLGASLSNHRWWMMTGLLILNTVLFFALR